MSELNAPVTPLARNRKPFFVVLGLFFAPLILAFAVYYGSSWRPSGTTNKGELIAPAVPLPQVTLIKADGNRTDANFLRKDWALVYVGEGQCDEACRTALLATANVRQLLGKDMTRVQRVFLFNGSCCEASFFADQTDLISASLMNESGQTLLQHFPSQQGIAASAAGRTYIVDPLGNLMMSYARGTDPRSIYQDLKKLLTLSHIG